MLNYSELDAGHCRRDSRNLSPGIEGASELSPHPAYFRGGLDLVVGDIA